MRFEKLTFTVVGVLLASPVAFADATVDQLIKTRFSGGAGKVINVFAGKAAKEGLETRSSISGDRKATRTGRDIEVVDIGDEMIWRYSVNRKGKAKKCRASTFAEYREQMASLQDLPFLGGDGQSSQDAETSDGGPPPIEYEVSVNFVDTGETESHAGMTGKVYRLEIIAHQPGLSIDEGGGILETTFVVGPKTESWAEAQAWHTRWAESVGFDTSLGQNLLSVLSKSPALQKVMEEMRAKESELDGTMLRTSMRLSTVPDPRIQAQARSDGDSGDNDTPTSLGGLGAKLGGAFLKKRREEAATKEGPKELYTTEVAVMAMSDMADAILTLPDTCQQ